MTNPVDPEIVNKIKNTQERIAVIAGVAMGVILCIYFFTFSMLIDKGSAFALWSELITSLLLLFGLIFLKRVAWFITRLVLGRNADYRRALKGLTVADLGKQPQ